MTHLTSVYLDLSVEETKDFWTFATSESTLQERSTREQEQNKNQA